MITIEHKVHFGNGRRSRKELRQGDTPPEAPYGRGCGPGAATWPVGRDRKGITCRTASSPTTAVSCSSSCTFCHCHSGTAGSPQSLSCQPSAFAGLDELVVAERNLWRRIGLPRPFLNTGLVPMRLHGWLGE